MIETFGAIAFKWLYDNYLKDSVNEYFEIFFKAIVKSGGKSIDENIKKAIQNKRQKKQIIDKFDEIIEQTKTEYRKKYPNYADGGNFYESQLFWNALFTYNFYLTDEEKFLSNLKEALSKENQQGKIFYYNSEALEDFISIFKQKFEFSEELKKIQRDNNFNEIVVKYLTRNKNNFEQLTQDNEKILIELDTIKEQNEKILEALENIYILKKVSNQISNNGNNNIIIKNSEIQKIELIRNENTIIDILKTNIEIIESIKSFLPKEEETENFVKNRYILLQFGAELGQDVFKEERRNYYYDFYYDEFVKKEIEQAKDIIEKNRNLIIKGDILAGKTRFAIELLKNHFPEKIIIKPSINVFSEKQYREIFIKVLEKYKGKDIIIFLDDINEFFFQNDNFKLYFDDIRENAPIIATIRKGDEYYLLRDKLTNLREIFRNEIEIKRIDRNKAESVLKILKDNGIERELSNLKDFIEKKVDFTIGSFILDLQAKFDRYEKLIKKDWKIKKIPFFQKMILRTLKVFYFSYNYVKPEESESYRNTFYFDNIITYIKKYTQTTKSFKFNQETINQAALDLSRIDDYSLQFVDYNQLKKLITIEPAYLYEIIEEPDIDKIKEEIFYLYPNVKDRKKLGFYSQLVYYNIQINSFENYNEIEEIIKQMEELDIKKDIYTYSILINKAPTYEQAVEWFEKMKNEKIKLDEVSYSTLISKSPTYEQAVEWFEKMKNEKIKPNVYSYTTLIKISPNYNTALQWFYEMKEKNINPNIVSYTTLMKKCGDKDIAVSILKDIKENRVKPNALTLKTFLYFASKDKQKQKQLIKDFIQIFTPGTDFGVREFRRLRLHPIPVLLLAEEIYRTAPHQKALICVLLDKILQDRRANDYFKQQAQEFKNTVGCKK